MSVLGMSQQLRAIRLVSGPLGTQTPSSRKRADYGVISNTDPALFLSQNNPEVAKKAAAE
jgi:hypothetical protein